MLKLPIYSHSPDATLPVGVYAMKMSDSKAYAYFIFKIVLLQKKEGIAIRVLIKKRPCFQSNILNNYVFYEKNYQLQEDIRCT